MPGKHSHPLALRAAGQRARVLFTVAEEHNSSTLQPGPPSAGTHIPAAGPPAAAADVPQPAPGNERSSSSGEGTPQPNRPDQKAEKPTNGASAFLAAPSHSRNVSASTAFTFDSDISAASSFVTQINEPPQLVSSQRPSTPPRVVHHQPKSPNPLNEEFLAGARRPSSQDAPAARQREHVVRPKTSDGSDLRRDWRRAGAPVDGGARDPPSSLPRASSASRRPAMHFEDLPGTPSSASTVRPAKVPQGTLQNLQLAPNGADSAATHREAAPTVPTEQSVRTGRGRHGSHTRATNGPGSRAHADMEARSGNISNEFDAGNRRESELERPVTMIRRSPLPELRVNGPGNGQAGKDQAEKTHDKPKSQPLTSSWAAKWQARPSQSKPVASYPDVAGLPAIEVGSTPADARRPLEIARLPPSERAASGRGHGKASAKDPQSLPGPAPALRPNGVGAGPVGHRGGHSAEDDESYDASVDDDIDGTTNENSLSLSQMSREDLRQDLSHKPLGRDFPSRRFDSFIDTVPSYTRRMQNERTSHVQSGDGQSISSATSEAVPPPISRVRQAEATNPNRRSLRVALASRLGLSGHRPATGDQQKRANSRPGDVSKQPSAVPQPRKKTAQPPPPLVPSSQPSRQRNQSYRPPPPSPLSSYPSADSFDFDRRHFPRHPATSPLGDRYRPTHEEYSYAAARLSPVSGVVTTITAESRPSSSRKSSFSMPRINVDSFRHHLPRRVDSQSSFGTKQASQGSAFSPLGRSSSRASKSSAETKNRRSSLTSSLRSRRTVTKFPASIDNYADGMVPGLPYEQTSQSRLPTMTSAPRDLLPVTRPWRDERDKGGYDAVEWKLENVDSRGTKNGMDGPVLRGYIAAPARDRP